jgi:signal peptidase I
MQFAIDDGSPMADDAASKSEGSVKETIESILVAFILAFIFRCFVVEAFVIPTGSMAPTLMGAYMPFRCSYCGYSFQVGFSTGSDETFNVPEAAPGSYGFFCPNCGLRLPYASKDDPDNDATDPSVRYGDRILVMKYIYLLHEPKRWDVVVFKSPVTSADAPDYSVNYIKRLAGNPGESLLVAQGDLWVAPRSDNPEDYKDPSKYKVQTKPRWVQDALWRIIYDCDFVPATQPPNTPSVVLPHPDPAWQQPWKQVKGTGWVNDDAKRGVSPRDFVFDNLTGDGVLTFDKSVNPNKNAMTDFLAYDQQASRYDGVGSMPLSSVADLKLNFTLKRFEGDGALRLVLKRDEMEFIGELTRTGVRLLRRNRDGDPTVLAESKQPITAGMQVSLENVDYHVALCIDGKEVLGTTEAQNPAKLDAVIKDFRRSPEGGARIEGDRVKAEIRHLQLWRDVYYRDTDSSVLRATAFHFPEKVVRLKKDEYFVMGDNSLMSLDARMWSVPVNLPEEGIDVEAGRVPEQFMLGKAFFVYWPAGYRPVKQLPALVPNFGSMRFIR